MKKKILFAALALCAICLFEKENQESYDQQTLETCVNSSINELVASVIPPRVPQRPDRNEIV